MLLVNKFKKSYTRIGGGSNPSGPEVPEGLLKKCNMCKAAIYTDEVIANHYICPKCKGYFKLNAMKRIEMITESGSFEPWDEGMDTVNPLQYKGYVEKIEGLRKKTGLDEAVVSGLARIGEHKVVLAVCDSRFMMASMGSVVGEKITRAVERATREQLPVIIFACSGGARMQEGMVSLMQMAKTSAALKRHSDAGLLYISVLTDPTTGGVTASFAMLGDIILAEPGALIGFAGPRVIEQTIGQKLPKGFQRSEFLLEHGFIDQIVPRPEMKQTLKQILDMHRSKEADVMQVCTDVQPLFSLEIDEATHSAWDRVQISRKKDRPVGQDYIDHLMDHFVEFHGDRYFGDDTAIVGGIGYYKGRPVTVIAQCKGKETKENIRRNFGMPSPEGYRKALRLMKQAEKFHRPVLCLVDTPGAFCGLEAEERGQGEAIARNLYELSTLKTPILSIVIGEGGSGGALALAVADEVWMLRNSVYSILSPEGYATILWKDSSKAKEAAAVMRMTADDLLEMHMIEGIIEEPQEYTVDQMSLVQRQIEEVLDRFLKEKSALTEKELTEARYQRFRRM